MNKFDKRYNEIILEYSENQKQFQNITLAIVPGSFKPPHKGHWEMIMEYVTHSDKVLVLISNISKKANSERILSKSALFPLSKILSNYTLENEQAISIITSIKENADKLTLESLEKYINDSRKYLLNNKLSEYLILNNSGSKITTRGVEYIIDKMVNEAAIKHKISPHVLRHTFATHMLNGGADIKSIQQLLGHESLSTTGIYTHITNDVLRQEYLKNHPRSKLN